MQTALADHARFSSGPGTGHAIPALLLFLVLLSGCTFNHNLTTDLTLADLPAAPKEPMTVGMYYSPEISAATYARLHTMHRYIVPIGKDSVSLFNRVAGMSFREVVVLDGLPPFRPSPAAVDLIIEPEIEDFHFRLGLEGDKPEHSIRYRLHFYTKDGMLLGTRRVTGKQVPVIDHFTVTGYIEDNLADAAVKILQEFHRLPVPATTASATAGNLSSGLSVTAVPVQGPLRLADDMSLRLAEAGIIAITVSAENTGDRRLSISEADMRLALGQGRAICSSGPLGIPVRLEQRSYAAEAFGIVGGLIQAASQNATSTQMRIALEERRFGDRTLGPGEKAEGLVFFLPAQDTPPFTSADLSYWVLDAASGGAQPSRTPLSGIQFGLKADH